MKQQAIIATCAALLFSFSNVGLATQHTAEGAPTSESAKEESLSIRGNAELITLSAMVEAVDYDNRTLKLKDKEGNLTELTASEAIQNLPDFKVGDQVKAHYYQTVFVQLLKNTSGIRKSVVQEGETMSATGKKPVGVARKTVVVSNVIAVDPDKPSVTLKGPRGNAAEIEVEDPDRMKELDVKVGDQVEITYGQMTAVKLER